MQAINYVRFNRHSSLRSLFIDQHWPTVTSNLRLSSQQDKGHNPKNEAPGESSAKQEPVDPKSYFYPNTSVGIKERSVKPEHSNKQNAPIQTPYPPFPDGKNPKTGEVGGPAGPEPTRFGDWERKGRVSDF